MKLKLSIKILLIIFLLITIFSCKKDLINEEEVVGLVRLIESPRGSFSSTLILERPEKANGEVHYGGHIYYKGDTYYKEYYLDEFDKKMTEEFSKYIYRIIRVKAYPTNGYMGMNSLTYLLNPQIIEVKDIDYSVISENLRNPDSYIWK